MGRKFEYNTVFDGKSFKINIVGERDDERIRKEKLIDRMLKFFHLARLSNLRSARESLVRDEKTGLFNSKIISELGEHKFYNVLYFDMDGMKKINDTYGHKFGDAAIFAFSVFLRSMFKRATDKVIRSNNAGDEFIVITESGVPKLPDGFIANIFGKEMTLSFTYGLVKHVPGMRIHESIERADKICVEKKHDKHGRSKV